MRRIIAKLGERGAWKGQLMLRRKAISILNHRCALMYRMSGYHGAALLRSIKALVEYPWPYFRDEVVTPFERPKSLISTGLCLLRLK